MAAADAGEAGAGPGQRALSHRDTARQLVSDAHRAGGPLAASWPPSVARRGPPGRQPASDSEQARGLSGSAARRRPRLGLAGPSGPLRPKGQAWQWPGGRPGRRGGGRRRRSRLVTPGLARLGLGVGRPAPRRSVTVGAASAASPAGRRDSRACQWESESESASG